MYKIMGCSGRIDSRSFDTPTEAVNQVFAVYDPQSETYKVVDEQGVTVAVIHDGAVWERRTAQVPTLIRNARAVVDAFVKVQNRDDSYLIYKLPDNVQNMIYALWDSLGVMGGEG